MILKIAYFITTWIFVIAWFKNSPDVTGLTLAIVDFAPWLFVIPEMAMEKAITARDVGDPVAAILWGGAVFCLYCALLVFNVFVADDALLQWKKYKAWRKGRLDKGMDNIQRKRKALGYDK